MRRKSFFAALGLLTAVTLCLLLVMQQQYPATLSRLLTGMAQTAPTSVKVTAWPNNRETDFTIEDPAVLEELWALMADVPLVEQNKTPRFYPAKGCYRFSVDGGREVLTDGVYLYTENRSYTARTLPALLSALHLADEKAQAYYSVQGGAVLPAFDQHLQWTQNFYAELEPFGLDAPGKFYVLTRMDDGRWLCYASPQYASTEALLTAYGVTLPQQLGDYRLTDTANLSFTLEETPWHHGGTMLLEGDFEPGQIYDRSDRLTVDYFSADYVGPAENPEHPKPTCPGLSVSFSRQQGENDLSEPLNGYTEEPPFDGSDLCAELAGWQVKKRYSYAMGIQFEKGWTFTAPNGWLSAQFVTLYEVSDPANINWHHQAVHRDMTREELAEEGAWLLPLLDVANAMK